MGEHLKLTGSWNAVSSTNFEEMLSKIEAPFVVRYSATLLKPKHIISFEENVMMAQIEAKRPNYLAPDLLVVFQIWCFLNL